MQKPGRFGPGLLVTAAFIGPGTVTTASLAGAKFGHALMWVVLFAVLATIVLQEMTARIGVVTGRGLGEAVRDYAGSPLARRLAAVAIIASIGLGNAAFQTGNVLGAAAGLEGLIGTPRGWGSAGVGLSAATLLFFGGYQTIERLLACLVGLMSLLFVVTAVLIQPSAGDMLRGCAIPSLPEHSLVTVIALIGTTVVPYNLFLHASAVAKKWPATLPTRERLSLARNDLMVAVAIGGGLTLAIVVTAAETFHARGIVPTSAAELAGQLEPLLGRHAQRLFAAGFATAGVTSALTAPLAGAFATAGVLGWKMEMRSWRFRMVWMLILAVGTGAATIDHKPLTMILWAQAVNGVVLPVVAVLLLVVVNSEKLLAQYRNTRWSNLLGAAVICLVIGLGVRNLIAAIGKLAS